MSTESSFEMYEMLLERQNITRGERLALKASMDTLDTKIKNLISRVKNRPRESDDELVKRMDDVELYHNTHPQTNKDEREFMRELKLLKNKRKELVEYNIIQGEIDMLKSKRSANQVELKEKEACLDELYSGARRMRAAHKLHCDPNSLSEETMSIPVDKFRMVIGAAGSNVKKMEDECLVCIDMDRGRPDATEGKLKLYYDGANNKVEEAKTMIQTILDTRIEEWSLSNEKITCLLNKRAAIVMKLQEVYDVRIDISKAKLLCKVSGLSDNVEAVVSAINSLEVSTAKIDLAERRVIAYILGKGRPVFQSLLDEHSVDVQLEKDAEPPTATVVGAKASVSIVSATLKKIVEENKEIEEDMTFERHVVLDAIIGSKGVIISQLQRDFNVRLIVDKDKSTTSTAIIEIKGNAENVKAVKEHILERIHAYQSDTVVVPVPEGLLAGILGKKGSRISALRKKHPAVVIDVTSESSSVRLHSTDPVQRLAAVDEVEKYIAANMQKDFPMSKSTTITLKGASGADARKHLTETLQLNLDIDTEGEVVHLRGRNPDIDQGIQYLTIFCEDNFELEIKCDADDAGSLMNGKEEAPQRVVEQQFGIKTFYSRKNDLFRLVGSRDAVNDAKAYIEDFLDGKTEKSALVSITPSGIGALVGRGGSNIKNFEKKHSVRVDILKPKDLVRLHGSSAADVCAAELDLLGFLDSLVVNVIVEDLQDKWDNRSDSVTCRLDELLSQAKSMFGVGLNKVEKNVKREDEGDDAEMFKKITVTFFGTPRRANAAKDFVLDEIRGTTTACLRMLPHHIEQLSTPENMAKLEQSASSSNVTAALSDNGILLTGPVAFISKAKIQVNRLLDFLFTGEFSSVIADSRTMLALWNFEVESDFKNQVVGGQISFDFRMSCIRVFASTSISHTLGVEYIRNAIAEFKKRVVTIEVNEDIFGVIAAKKSVYFGPIETKHKCKLATEVVARETSDSSTTKQYMIVIEGKTEKMALAGEASLRGTIDRLEKENWMINLKGDIVGALIGKGGKNVKALREETKANINIDMKTGNIEVSGKEESVQEAKARILQFVADKERDSHVTYVPITPDCIPRVIGTKGANIRELRVVSKAASIDIDRDDNVIVVKGSVESGLKAKEEIIALLMKDNIDISKLRYITPEERKAAAMKKAEVEKAMMKKQKQEQQSIPGKSNAPQGVANTKEAYLALLNTPGISKNSIRRIKRKMRDEEQGHEQQEDDTAVDEDDDGNDDGNEDGDAEQVSAFVEGDISDQKLLNSAKVEERTAVPSASDVMSVNMHSKQLDSKNENLSSTVDTSFPPKMSSPIETSVRLDPVYPSIPVISTQSQGKVAIPKGEAGNILSMILGTTPVTSSANRLRSPRSMASGGLKHGAIGSISKPISSYDSARQQKSESISSKSGSDVVESSYYKSRTGRAIRLD